MNLSAPLVHRLLVRATLASAHLFAWVFIFQYFYIQTGTIAGALGSALFTYALSHAIVVLLTPYSAKCLRHGFRRTLIIATILLAASFAVLASAFSGSLGNVGLGVALFAILSAMYRAFYWTPYELFKVVAPEGRREWVEIVVALMPLIAGLYVATASASVAALLYAAGALALLACIPLAGVRDAYEGYSFTYRSSFHELFDERNRMLLRSSFLSGVEAAALFILWPITVFTLIGWSYPLLGMIMSLTLLITLIARKFLARPVDSMPARVLPLVAMSGWVMRLGVGGFVSAVLVDAYFHTLGRSSLRGLDIHTQEHVADSHTFVDEFTVLKEMGMALGRIALCLAAVFLLSFTPLPYALAISFLAAGLAAALSIYFALRPTPAF
jgi:hypothetical protein